MVLEVAKQLKDTLAFLYSPGEGLIEKISSRDDYIDSLKGRIEDNCFASMLSSRSRGVSKQAVDRARAITIISSNLERIGDYVVNIVAQMQYLSDRSLLDEYNYKAVFKELIRSLGLVDGALFNRDIGRAMEICQSEDRLDKVYAQILNRIIREISSGEHVENRITLLFIIGYLERMGDALLNIGEAIIFAAMGQKLKIHQYKAIEDTIATAGMQASMNKISFETITGTRSGCSIGQVRNEHQAGQTQRVIFKKGNLKKLLREKENIEKWQQIAPGLVPGILNFQQTGSHASMLVEYVGSTTLQNIMLNGADKIFSDAFRVVQKMLVTIWTATRKDQPANARYMKQLAARIQDVYTVHPSFKLPEKQINGLNVDSVDRLIRRAGALDKKLSAPFSVFIHGDFNIDNIMYDGEGGGIHFIDLHRSEDSDYVQDVSVFLVSNFRQPIFSPPLRKRLNTVIRSFYRFARDFADSHGDTTFDARLALGLARSFITSTRFELDRKFAEAMFLRAIYLLEKLASHSSAAPESFVLPQDTFVY